MIKFVPLKIDFDLPQLDSKKIADEDRNLDWEIYSNLHSVARYGEDFGAAVHLFDFALIKDSELRNLMPPAPNREGRMG